MHPSSAADPPRHLQAARVRGRDPAVHGPLLDAVLARRKAGGPEAGRPHVRGGGAAHRHASQPRGPHLQSFNRSQHDLKSMQGDPQPGGNLRTTTRSPQRAGLPVVPVRGHHRGPRQP
ncbi:hypothetical protein QJS66_19315 [Kocuria rhizophila]|nr:hypothetical protein QJS66_19315 [Kocuria rhizophila]